MLALFENACFDEDSRRGADSAKKPPFLFLAAKPIGQGRGRLKVVRSLAAAGKHYCVEVVLLGLSEGSVGAHHDAMGAAHLGTARESRGNDLDPAATEDVYRRDGLDVLEAVREHYKRFSRHS